MVTVQRSSERGHFDHGWLDTYHSFSFGDYHDPRRMGYRSLRVLNEDRVQGGGGFPMHGHRDMEILTWVLEGALVHRDSLGNGSLIRPGELQRMSAGTGIRHSEANASGEEAVHLLQIWLRPALEGRVPGYEQRAFDPDGARGRWRLLASSDGRDGSVTIGQDASLYQARLEAGEVVRHDLAAGRGAWLQVARGVVAVEGQVLAAGDAAAWSASTSSTSVTVEARGLAEVLLFDLA